MQIIRKYYTYLIGASILLSSCKKFVEIAPSSALISKAGVFSNDATARASLYGMYSELINSSGFVSGGGTALNTLTGMSADELVAHYDYTFYTQFYTNSLTAGNEFVYSSVWGSLYKQIYYANSILEGLEISQNLSDGVKKSLNGEGRFMRAFCYFYLANLFDKVPLALTTDYRINNALTRSDKATVYNQIVSDLQEAVTSLEENYSGTERLQPNRGAAQALLARVYLFMGNYEKAEEYATDVIGSASYALEHDLDQVFLNTSREAIWQLKQGNPAYNTHEANTFVLTWDPFFVSMQPSVADSFDVADKRLASWVGIYDNGITQYYFPYKYKRRFFQQPYNELSTVLRLAEQFLIRSEARAYQDNMTGAIADLDSIRNRAGLPLIANTNPGISRSDLLAEIYRERFLEYFTEWGHRWFDLVRTGNADIILKNRKGSSWSADDKLYPIPTTERLNNPNLDQNKGY